MALYQRTVLIVEDEPFIRLDLCDALDDEGYRVLEARTVLEAIGLLSKYRTIDGLVTDVDLPGGLNGFDLVELVAQCCPDAAIIVASARDHSARMPADAPYLFIPKPYAMAEILCELDARMVARPDGLRTRSFAGR